MTTDRCDFAALAAEVVAASQKEETAMKRFILKIGLVLLFVTATPRIPLSFCLGGQESPEYEILMDLNGHVLPF